MLFQAQKKAACRCRVKSVAKADPSVVDIPPDGANDPCNGHDREQDNSDPLNPKDATFVVVLRKVFKSVNNRDFFEVYQYETAWTLSTGVEMDIDAEGGVTLNSGTTGKLSCRGSGKYNISFNWDQAATSYYAVNLATLTADSFEMTPTDIQGDVTGDAITMTRK